MKIVIDSEFKALIPPLSAEERAQLEANIVADGCRDPLVVWPLPEFTHVLDEETGESETFKYADKKVNFIDGDSPEGFDFWESSIYADTYDGEDWPHVLIDGHNRYEICTRLGLPFEVVQKSLEGRPQARMWIRANQYGRRNLSSFVRAELALGDKADIAEIAKAQQIRKPADFVSPMLAKQTTPIDTREEVSKRAGISHGSLDKVEAIKASNPQPEILSAVRSGEVSINLAAQFIALPQEVREEAEATIAAESDPAKEVMREAVKNHRAIGTGENEWYTPAEYVELAREVMGGIDLDPASCAQANEVVGAATFYTKEDDGLSKDWAGRLWLNPPYSRDLMPAFVEKLRTSFMDGAVDQAVLVSHNNTDTAWFHTLAGVASAICFPKKRIRFYRDAEVAAPTNGQAFFYLGDDPQKFISTFESVGFVVRPA